MRRLTSVGIIATGSLLLAASMTDARATTYSSTAFTSSIGVGNWTPIFQGIDETTATIKGTGGDVSQAYIVQIDTTAPGISFTTTPLAPGGAPVSASVAAASGTTSNGSNLYETIGQTTAQFLRSSGTQVAINADFFAPCGCYTTPTPDSQKYMEGLAISNGTLVAPNNSSYADLLITAANKASIVAGSNTNPTGVYNAVSGSNIVVRNGKNVYTSTAGDSLNPRSVAGVSQDGQYLYLVAIDGRQTGYSNGVFEAEEADLLVDLGAFAALNLDGGGSTALVAEGANGNPDVLNLPSNDAAHDERYDSNSFGVYADPLQVPEPTTLALFGSAVLGLMLVARRRFSL
jgi:hypothetical protein